MQTKQFYSCKLKIVAKKKKLPLETENYVQTKPFSLKRNFLSSALKEEQVTVKLTCHHSQQTTWTSMSAEAAARLTNHSLGLTPNETPQC